MTVTVRGATADDSSELGVVLGRAFADDPVFQWTYPQSDRARRLAKMFVPMVRLSLRHGATVLTDDGLRGAAIWHRSERRNLGPVANIVIGIAMITRGARMRRGLTVLRALERRHPKEPHRYLEVLGTDPAHQGHGVGSALIRHVLDDPANAGDAAYLETETEANVSFYRRHGFEVVEEFDVPGGGPHFWLMWRDPVP